jgi:hypothetical protein
VGNGDAKEQLWAKGDAKAASTDLRAITGTRHQPTPISNVPVKEVHSMAFLVAVLVSTSVLKVAMLKLALFL